MRVLIQKTLMADIQLPENKGRKRLQPPKVDLTPMVDLGFILITFFMYTTTLNETKSMVIDKPYNPPPPGVQTTFVDTSTITIMPAGGNKIYYYYGALDGVGDIRLTNHKDIRNVIINKHKELKKLPATFSELAHELQVVIKPTNESNFENLVSIMDEMLINKVPHYALVDISAVEEELISKL